MLRRGETIEILGEVLHHVVTFGLAVHEHIQTQIFLEFNNGGDLFTQELLKLLLRDFTGTRLCTVAANISGLRERTNGCGRQLRQIQIGLGIPADFQFGTLKILRFHGCGTLTDCRIMLTRVRRETCQRFVGGLQLCLNRRLTVGKTAGKSHDLGDFLVGKSQTVYGHIGGVFKVKIVRHMLQRG